MRRSIGLVLACAGVAAVLGGCGGGGGGGNDGAISFTAVAYNVNEDGTLPTPADAITLHRTGGTGAVSVTVTFTDGTATGGPPPDDYDNTPQVVSWAAGDLADKTIVVPIFDDHNDEPDETLTMTITAPTGGAVVGAPASATLTIIDNDVAGTVQFSSASYHYNEAGFASGMQVTVTRTGGMDGDIDVTVTSTDGTANSDPSSLNEPVDYAPVFATAHFADQDTTPVTITLTIVDDLLPELDETFMVHLSNPTNGAQLGAPSDATVTIIDNDSGLEIDNPTGDINGFFGTSLAKVGQRLAVGAPGNGSGQGRVFLMDLGTSSGPSVFHTFDGGPFSQQFGWSLSFRGNTLAVGGQGEAWALGGDIVLEQFFTRFTASSPDAGFGSTVWVQGASVFVGAPQTQIGGSLLPSGRVHPYDIVNGAPGATIDGVADHQLGAAFGTLGTDVLIGATGNNGYVYGYDDSTFAYDFGIANPFPQMPGGEFGSAIAGAGLIILVGAPGAHTFAPADGRLFVLDGGPPQAFLAPGPITPNGRFGSNILITSDGHTCVQQQGGGPAGTGRVFIFDSSFALTQIIDDPVPAPGANFGGAMCEFDGVLVIASPHGPGFVQSGSIFFFKLL